MIDTARELSIRYEIAAPHPDVSTTGRFREFLRFLAIFGEVSAGERIFAPGRVESEGGFREFWRIFASFANFQPPQKMINPKCPIRYYRPNIDIKKRKYSIDRYRALKTTQSIDTRKKTITIDRCTVSNSIPSLGCALCAKTLVSVGTTWCHSFSLTVLVGTSR